MKKERKNIETEQVKFLRNVSEYALENQIRNTMISEAVLPPDAHWYIDMAIRYPDMDRSG
jgi:hypothetical protein